MTHRAIIAIIAAALLLAAGCTSSSGSESLTPNESNEANEAVEQPGTSSGTLERYAGYETVNYDDPSHWVCRPDITDDICDGDLDATLIEADGTLTVEPFEKAEDPAIDCFYVYPTISKDETAYSDWEASDSEEGYVTLNQAGRLQSQCRLYAPVYRQITLAGLGTVIGGDDAGVEGDPYADVADAFETYMANDNGGRGIVLIGHSQGAAMLNQLIANEFDTNDDVRELLVGAYLAGGSVAVPEGELVGGDFDNVALCSSEGETGCVDTWATFRDTAPPPEGSFFGAPRSGEGEAGCVNPAAVAGGAADLDSYFPVNRGASILSPEDATDEDAPGWVDPSAGEITTPFVRFTDLLTGLCASSNGFNYLGVSVNAEPGDLRANDIGGDLSPEWGLHLVDVNIVMGDVVAQVASQIETYTG